ncbi:MAG: HEAT repeat domain-containing protein [Planctomycetota bacterium]
MDIAFPVCRSVPRALLVWAGCALLLAGCGPKPNPDIYHPPVTMTDVNGHPEALIDLRTLGGDSVLQAMRGQQALDNLAFTDNPGKPTPVLLPKAPLPIDALLVFPPGQVYNPDDPQQVAVLRAAFEHQNPIAKRLQAIEWAASRQDARFIDNIASEMVAGSLIAAQAAEALGRFAGTPPAAAQRARDALLAVLGNNDYLLRAAAIRALAVLGDTAALPALRARFLVEQTENIRVLLCHAMGYLLLHGSPPAAAGELAAVQAELRTPERDSREDPVVRAAAAVSLVATGDQDGLDLLKSLATQSPTPEMQYLGIEGMVLAGSSDAPLYVLSGLEADSPIVWCGSIELCALLPPDSILPQLERMLHRGDLHGAVRADLALAFLRQDEALVYLPYVIENGISNERVLGLTLLGRYKRVEYAERCAHYLDDDTPGVREAAAQALLDMGATSYAARVAAAAHFGNPYTRYVLTAAAAQLARDAEQAAQVAAEHAHGNGNGPATSEGGAGGTGGAATGQGGTTGPAGANAAAVQQERSRELHDAFIRVQRATLDKLRLVGLSIADDRPVAAVFRDAQGKEKTALVGEYVYGDFTLASLHYLRPAEPAADGHPAVPASGPVVAVLSDGSTQASYQLNAAPEMSEVAGATAMNAE